MCNTKEIDHQTINLLSSYFLHSFFFLKVIPITIQFYYNVNHFTSFIQKSMFCTNNHIIEYADVRREKIKKKWTANILNQFCYYQFIICCLKNHLNDSIIENFVVRVIFFSFRARVCVWVSFYVFALNEFHSLIEKIFHGRKNLVLMLIYL